MYIVQKHLAGRQLLTMPAESWAWLLHLDLQSVPQDISQSSGALREKNRQSYCVFPRKMHLLPMKEDRPGLTSGLTLFIIIFGSSSGSFVEDTLKKEKQGFSSSYATDAGLKSDANGKSLFLWKCNTTFSFCLHYYLSLSSPHSKFCHALKDW